MNSSHIGPRTVIVTAFILAFIGMISTSSVANARCWWNCNYAKTQYPIVLAHGFLGAEEYLGILDYWYGIPEYLEKKNATVYVTEVSAANSSKAYRRRNQAATARPGCTGC